MGNISGKIFFDCETFLCILQSGRVCDSKTTFSEDFMHVTINAALADLDLGGGDIDLNNLTLLSGGKE